MVCIYRFLATVIDGNSHQCIDYKSNVIFTIKNYRHAQNNSNRNNEREANLKKQCTKTKNE